MGFIQQNRTLVAGIVFLLAGTSLFLLGYAARLNLGTSSETDKKPATASEEKNAQAGTTYSGRVVAASPNSLAVETDGGRQITFSVPAESIFVDRATIQVASDTAELRTASYQDIKTGDRVTISVKPGSDSQTLVVTNVTIEEIVGENTPR